MTKNYSLVKFYLTILKLLSLNYSDTIKITSLRFAPQLYLYGIYNLA